MDIEITKKDNEYIIGTCDKCCGYYPRLNATIINKEICYEVYCTNCGKGTKSNELWRSVMLWNKTMRGII